MDAKPARRPTSSHRALHDAGDVVERIEADERAASEERARYRAEGVRAIDVDPDVAALLGDGEAVVGTRRATRVERHPRDASDGPLTGRLFVTTRRLVVRGRETVSIDLGLIDELSVAGERVLITLRDGTGLVIDCSWPRLLRAHIAGVLVALRGVRPPDTSVPPQRDSGR